MFVLNLKRRFSNSLVEYYGVLGLPLGSSPLEIKAAYKKLTKKYHPDVSTDPESKKKF